MSEVKNLPVVVRAKPRRIKPTKIWSRRSAREVIAAAAARLGGEDGLVAWVQKDPKNELVFWARIYPRLISVDVTVEAGERLAYALTWRPPT